MKLTRRNACLLLPLVSTIPAWTASSDSLPSSIQPFESLRAEKEGQATFRSILEGHTHTGDYLEVHETVLEPNAAPHPPHRHVGEEMFLIIAGTVEMTVNGKTARVGPGSAVFVASNEEHGLHNASTGSAQYFVVTLGSKAV